jgi:hypothetical protein
LDYRLLGGLAWFGLAACLLAWPIAWLIACLVVELIASANSEFLASPNLVDGLDCCRLFCVSRRNLYLVA